MEPHNNEENVRAAIVWTMDFMCFWKKRRWTMMTDDGGEMTRPKTALRSLQTAGEVQDSAARIKSIGRNIVPTA